MPGRSRGLTVMALGLGLVLSVGAVVTFAQSRDLIDEGRRAFVAAGCHGCHTIGTFGARIGPDLSRVGERYSASYMARWLRDPESQRPAAHMPALELSEEQVEALAAFLSAQR